MLNTVRRSLEVSGQWGVGTKVDCAQRNNDSANSLLAGLWVAVVHGKAQQVLCHLVIVYLWRDGSCYIGKNKNSSCGEFNILASKILYGRHMYMMFYNKKHSILSAA